MAAWTLYHPHPIRQLSFADAAAGAGRYRHYHGAAAASDIIFVVLESVRRADVSLYGYSRETTPVFHAFPIAMVFSNVYVAQPRSGKTMEAFFPRHLSRS